MKTITLPGLGIFTVLLVVVSLAQHPALAEVSVTNTSEGVSSDIDKKRRSPNVTVTTLYEDGAVKLLTEAYIPNKEFRKYPIQFNFFVNRHLFATQIRTPELPGAVGVTVTPDVATIPFNFTVVAKVLHPNREFTTVFIGAALPIKTGAILDCSLSKLAVSEEVEDPADEDELIFVANDITTTVPSENKIGISFKAKDTFDTSTANVESELSVTDGSANGTVSITIDGVAESIDVTGQAAFTGGSLSSLAVSSDDGALDLSCSTAAS